MLMVDLWEVRLYVIFVFLLIHYCYFSKYSVKNMYYILQSGNKITKILL